MSPPAHPPARNVSAGAPSPHATTHLGANAPFPANAPPAGVPARASATIRVKAPRSPDRPAQPAHLGASATFPANAPPAGVPARASATIRANARTRPRPCLSQRNVSRQRNQQSRQTNATSSPRRERNHRLHLPKQPAHLGASARFPAKATSTRPRPCLNQRAQQSRQTNATSSPDRPTPPAHPPRPPTQPHHTPPVTPARTPRIAASSRCGRLSSQ